MAIHDSELLNILNQVKFPCAMLDGDAFAANTLMHRSDKSHNVSSTYNGPLFPDYLGHQLTMRFMHEHARKPSNISDFGTNMQLPIR